MNEQAEPLIFKHPLKGDQRRNREGDVDTNRARRARRQRVKSFQDEDGSICHRAIWGTVKC